MEISQSLESKVSLKIRRKFNIYYEKMGDFHKVVKPGNLHVLSKGSIEDIGTEVAEPGRLREKRALHFSDGKTM